MMTTRQLRRFRNQYGQLYYLVYKAKQKGRGNEAKRIFNQWLRKKISYRDARRKLLALLK